MDRQTDTADWHTHTFRAMGCEMALWLELRSARAASAVLLEAAAMFARAERQLSRFDPASELSQLNASPGIWVPVSGLLWEVVVQALFLARETEGLFDPTLLAALEAAGYARSFEQLEAVGREPLSVIREPLSVIREPLSVNREPLSVGREPLSVGRGPSGGAAGANARNTGNETRNTDNGIRITDNGIRITDNGIRITDNGIQNTQSETRNPESPPWQPVRLNADGQAIWLPPGVRLDLGGIAKGYVAQQVVDFLSAWGPCLVDAGGDLTAGAAPAAWPGWPVAVLAPYAGPDAPRETLFPLWLVEGTMATSGIDYRRWQRHGRIAHHVIDPRTGQPAQTDLLTVTVLAKTAVRAEAWATAALVAGTAVAYRRLTAKNLAAALVDQTGDLRLTPALTPFVAFQYA